MIGGFDFCRSKFNRADAGLAADGLDLQAHRLHRGHRSRLHADVDHRGRAGGLPRRTRAAALLAAELRPEVRGRRSRCATRSSSRATCRRSSCSTASAPAVAIDYAKRFGFTSKFQPYLSMALGVTEETLLEATSAYTAFPHQGIRMSPYEVLRVVDRQGNVLEENHPEPNDAIRADTAYVMTRLLRASRREARRRPRRRSTGPSPGRRGRWMNIPTRGSSVSTRTSRSACGSGTTRRSRSATARPARWRRCRSGSR